MSQFYHGDIGWIFHKKIYMKKNCYQRVLENSRLIFNVYKPFSECGSSVSYLIVESPGLGLVLLQWEAGSWICPLNNDNDSVIKLIANCATDTYIKIQKLIFDDITKNEHVIIMYHLPKGRIDEILIFSHIFKYYAVKLTQ